jgi:hypothetical protein
MKRAQSPITRIRGTGGIGQAAMAMGQNKTADIAIPKKKTADRNMIIRVFVSLF